MMQVALDGPAGAGKSTIAKKLAKRLGYLYLDTGAMYRGVALYFVKNGLPYDSQEKVDSQLHKVQLTVRQKDGEQRVYLNGEDVSEAIRENEISFVSSQISAYPSVRQFLLEKQRELAGCNNIIMDGRDIGTVVLPAADVKIFLTASVKKRAIRRHWQLKSKGIDKSVKELMREIKQRDFQDSNRAIAPLKQAKDAILVDNSDLNLSQCLRKIIQIIDERREG